MFIDSVCIKNFHSFEEQDFSFKEHVKELCLIEGENGAGKSTIFDAIAWALFGTTFRGVKGDDVIRRKAKKNCLVQVNVTNPPMVIKRYRKHETFGDRLIIEDGSKTIEKGTLALTQAWLTERLGIDFDLLKCVIFSQDDSFNFVNAGNKDQKDILAKIMRINYSEYQKRAKDEYKKLESTLRDHEGNIAILTSHIDDDIEASCDKRIAQWEEQRAIKIKKIKDSVSVLMDNFATLNGEIKDVSELQSLKSKIDSAINMFEGKKKELSHNVGSHRGQISVFKKELEQISRIGAHCHTCFQSVNEKVVLARKRQVKEQIQELEEEAIQFSDKCEEIDEKISKYRANKEKVVRAIEEQRQKAKEVLIIEKRIVEENNRAEDEELAENPYVKEKEVALAKQKKIKEKIEWLRNERAGISEILPYYSFWVEAFGDSGIKSFVFDLICSTLTEQANKYLDILTNGTTTISFDTQQKLKSGETREKFDCEIITDGDRCMYETYSGGEKTRIALAVDMALSQLMQEYYKTQFNFVVFDERDEYLNNAGRRQYLSLLKEIAKNKTAYVISHDDTLKGMFDTTITVKKIEGISKIL